MKSTYFRLISILFVCFLTIVPAMAQKKGQKKTTFHVEMDCQSCVNTIEKNIPWEKGVTDLKCDLKTQTVEVTYKTSKTNDSILIDAFKKIGKEAVVIPEGEKAPATHENCSHDHKSEHKH
ncbi:MAG: heavy-metal-associated domain-containing protein [Bacteroidales bacterium]